MVREREREARGMKEGRYISVEFWHIIMSPSNAGRDAFHPVSAVSVSENERVKKTRHLTCALSEAGA